MKYDHDTKYDIIYLCREIYVNVRVDGRTTSGHVNITTLLLVLSRLFNILLYRSRMPCVSLDNNQSKSISRYGKKKFQMLLL